MDARDVRPNLSALDRRHRVAAGPTQWVVVPLAGLSALAAVHGAAATGDVVRVGVLGALVLAVVSLWVVELVRPRRLLLQDDELVVPGSWPWSRDLHLPWEDVVAVRPRWPVSLAVRADGSTAALPGLPRGEAERLAERVRLARSRRRP